MRIFSDLGALRNVSCVVSDSTGEIVDLPDDELLCSLSVKHGRLGLGREDHDHSA